MTTPSATSSVRTEGQLIVITAIGNLPAEALLAIHHKVSAILSQPQGPKDVLINLSAAHSLGPRASSVLSAFLDQASFHRLVVLAVHPQLMLLCRHLFKQADPSDTNERFKIFRDERLARAWLRQPHHHAPPRLQSLHRAG